MMSSKNNGFTAGDIERYHSGKMSPEERHALEKAALDDPFLAGAKLEEFANLCGDENTPMRKSFFERAREFFK